MEIRRHTLANGLRLLHYREPFSQMVTVNLMYDVGSKVEHPEHTGFAHLFEHLMFAGSAHVPDMDALVQEASGDNNAWTNIDVTNYYITLPVVNLETALYIESDRMTSLSISQESLDVQKQVVAEEFKQRFLNQPYGDASLLMRPLFYEKHPYAWPTIGKCLEHIERFELSDVQAFYRQYYRPDNAVLAVCGNVSFEKAVELVEKWFGDIRCPSAPVRPQIPFLPPQTAPRTLTVERNVPVPALYKSWHSPSASESGYQACDLLTDILSGGRSSRFTQRLIKQRHVFDSLDIYVGSEFEPGAGTVQFAGKPAKGISLEEADEVLKQELQSIVDEDVTKEELDKVKTKYESAFLFRNTDCQHIATQLCWFETLGKLRQSCSAESYLKDFDVTMGLDASDIRQVASEVFREDNCCTIFYRSK